ncbi:MAG: hypothetical protein FJ218_02650 [Ignavibacteria bacterium]|nr:hypothetical protein [Ignavibacteria bacterium]
MKKDVKDLLQFSQTENTGHQTKPFVEFGTMRQISGVRFRASGNVFKSKSIQHNREKTIHVTPGDDEDQPIIVIRRSEGVVDSIEFSCKCGRSSAVNLKYE